MGAPSRILVNDWVGHPFQIDLSTELARRGYDVHHTYSTTTVTPQASLVSGGNLTVHPIDIGHPFEKYDIAKRLADELRYGWASVRLAGRVRPDQVLTSNVPLVSLLLIWASCRVRRVHWTFWLQDIQSGLVGHAAGGIAARVAAGLERFLLRRADAVVAISEEFRDDAVALGCRPERVTVIENWAPLAELPLRPKANPWSRRFGLDERFCFLYSGTLGRKHSPELLAAVADAVPDAAVVVISEGEGMDWLAGEQLRTPRPNLVLLPYQPFAELPDVLGAADVLITLLDPAAGRYSVPSKTLTYLCAGRPIIASVPAENAAARLVAERAGAGVVVEPGDAEAIVTAAVALREDAGARAAMGLRARRHAEEVFDSVRVADRFVAAMGLAAAPGPATAHATTSTGERTGTNPATAAGSVEGDLARA